MIFDFFKKKNNKSDKVPKSGKGFHPENSDNQELDASRGLTPAKLDKIMTAANTGDIAEQCRLAFEIEEKNSDVAHTLSTRRNAVLGVKRTIEPGGESVADKAAAKAFEDLITSTNDGDFDSFDEMLSDMTTFLLPGFAASEIIWGSGGSIAGFSFLEPQHFTTTSLVAETVTNRELRLITRDNPAGMELPPHKFVIHKYRRRGSDVSRGGLIRPLAWLYCFANVNLKDLLRFIERYGMPFAMAQVDQDAWENDRNIIKRVIRNFGPDGGAVFNKAVELQLVEAANNSGDVYFKLLEYLSAAITRVVLGQTATAGDGGGWSKDSAQSDVRQDILEFDCTTLANTIRKKVIAPWAMFNHPSAKPPILKFHCEPPEDLKNIYESQKLRIEGIEKAVKSGMLTPTVEDEKAIREIFSLPEMNKSVIAEWKKNNGIRKIENPKPKDDLNEDKAALSDGASVDASEDKIAQNEGLNASFEPTLKDMAEFVDCNDPERAAKMLKKLNDPAYLELLEGNEMQKMEAEEIYAAIAKGTAGKSENLAKNE